MSWQGIGFDLDNTLFSHEKAFEKAIQHCFTTYLLKQGLFKEDISFNSFFPVFKKNSDCYWTIFETKKVTGTEYRRIRFNETMKYFGLPFSNKEADAFHNEYYLIVDEYSEPYPLLIELLSFLTEHNIELFVITNGMKDTQYNKIKKIGAAQWIPKDRVIVSEEVSIAKPHHEIFQLAEKRIKLPSNKLLFIGDSWKHDIVGAIDSGWEAIFLNTRQEKRTTSHEPVGEFKSFEKTAHFLMDRIGRRGS